MKVCKCDRCGRIFEPYVRDGEWSNTIIQTGFENFGLDEIVGEVEHSYDICDECYKSFNKWLRRGRINSRDE